MPPRSRRPQPARVSFRWTYGLVGAFVLLALGSGGFLVAAHMEDDDTFCASCHTQPESTYVSRAQAGQPTDLASYHTGAGDTPTKCIDCHSGSGVPGRAAAMTLGAFDLVSYLTGNARQPAPLTNPISDANCLKCHADTAATRDFNRHLRQLSHRARDGRRSDARLPQRATHSRGVRTLPRRGRGGRSLGDRGPTGASAPKSRINDPAADFTEQKQSVKSAQSAANHARGH